MSTEIILPEPRRQVAMVPATQDTNIMAVISRAAADPNCDIDKMERLMQMHERMQDKEKEQAFNAAMALMQCEIPTVSEGGLNTHTGNSYATLDDINFTLKPIMQKHGFAITFKVDHVGAGVKVTGILMHSAGHREDTTMFLPMDIGKGRNDVQAIGSSVTYARRYVMCALLNITTGDARDEDDGRAAASTPDPVITEIQVRQLESLAKKCSQRAQDAFAKLYPDVAEITKSQFDTVHNQLATSAAKHKEAAQ